jgi:hypothetical protein
MMQLGCRHGSAGRDSAGETGIEEERHGPTELEPGKGGGEDREIEEGLDALLREGRFRTVYR